MGRAQRVKQLSGARIRAFQKKMYGYFKTNGRIFEWRKTHDPYHILVSEVMLQQTHVARVEKKYPEFIAAFPDFRTLARASQSRVLMAWQGMGYNRRALALREIARAIMKRYGGRLPRNTDELDALPSIGVHTAGSIAAFAFNAPAVFIETNIRSVFIHEFFPSGAVVQDKDIMPLVEAALDRAHPRLWYYALMDYGAMLKKTMPNPSRRSAEYRRQSRFQGSAREARGAVVKTLLAKHRVAQSEAGLCAATGMPRMRVRGALRALIKEGFVATRKGKFVIGQQRVC